MYCCISSRDVAGRYNKFSNLNFSVNIYFLVVQDAQCDLPDHRHCGLHSFLGRPLHFKYTAFSVLCPSIGATGPTMGPKHSLTVLQLITYFDFFMPAHSMR